MNWKNWKKKLLNMPKAKVMKVLAAVGIVGVGTTLFVKRNKVKGAVNKMKNKIKKVG